MYTCPQDLIQEWLQEKSYHTVPIYCPLIYLKLLLVCDLSAIPILHCFGYYQTSNIFYVDWYLQEVHSDNLSHIVYIAIILKWFILLLFSESLLIISSLGVIVKKTNMFGTRSQFFEKDQIEDIVIVEAITMVCKGLCFIYL